MYFHKMQFHRVDPTENSVTGFGLTALVACGLLSEEGISLQA